MAVTTIDLGSVIGPKGDRGDTGARGPQGPQGPQGEVASYVIKTMTASGWDQQTGIYSFEADYPSGSYDIEIQPNNTCTTAQIAAWCAALITGSVTGNEAKALGTIPVESIPVIVKFVQK